jgi:hypothetical protein
VANFKKKKKIGLVAINQPPDFKKVMENFILVE